VVVRREKRPEQADGGQRYRAFGQAFEDGRKDASRACRLDSIQSGML
jgi:hypothetical protein